MDTFLGLVVLLLILAAPGVVTFALYVLLRGWARKVAIAIVLLLPVALLALTCIPTPPAPEGEEGKGLIVAIFQILAFVTLISMTLGVGAGWSRQTHGRASGSPN